MYAPVAQRIEHRIPVPRVGGSNPFWRTKGRTREGAAFDMPGGIRIIKYDLPVAGRRPVPKLGAPPRDESLLAYPPG